MDPRNNNTRTVAIWPVLLVNFIGSLGLSIVIPFLVFVVRGWGGNAIVYGIVASTYPAFQLMGAPVLGKWSDRIGRRKVLLVSQFGTLLSWLIFASAFLLPETHLLVGNGFVLTLPLLIVFAARALDGLTGGNLSVANAYVSDISTDANRSRNFGWMAASSSLGFIIGPALAGVLGSTALGSLLPVLVAAGISLVATVVIYFLLPESNPSAVVVKEKTTLRRTLGQEPKDCIDEEPGQRGWAAVIRQPGVPLMLVLYLLIFLAFNFFYASFPNQAAVNLEWNVQQIGWFFMLLSGLMVFVQGPILSRLARRISPAVLVIVGGLLMAICFAILIGSKPTATYVSAFFFAAGNGIMWPSFMAMLSRTGEQRMQGSIQGLATSAGGLASIIGLVAGGAIFSAAGAWAFLAPTITISVAVVFAVKLLSKFPQPLGQSPKS